MFHTVFIFGIVIQQGSLCSLIRLIPSDKKLLIGDQVRIPFQDLLTILYDGGLGILSHELVQRHRTEGIAV